MIFLGLFCVLLSMDPPPPDVEGSDWDRLCKSHSDSDGTYYLESCSENGTYKSDSTQSDWEDECVEVNMCIEDVPPDVTDIVPFPVQDNTHHGKV